MTDVTHSFGPFYHLYPHIFFSPCLYPLKGYQTQDLGFWHKWNWPEQAIELSKCCAMLRGRVAQMKRYPTSRRCVTMRVTKTPNNHEDTDDRSIITLRNTTGHLYTDVWCCNVSNITEYHLTTVWCVTDNRTKHLFTIILCCKPRIYSPMMKEPSTGTDKPPLHSQWKVAYHWR